MGPAVFEGETEIEIGFSRFVLGRNSFAFEGETEIEIGFIGLVLGRNSYWLEIIMVFRVLFIF